MKKNADKKRQAKRQKVVITSRQHVKRVEETTANWQGLLLATGQFTAAIKETLVLLDKTKSVAPETDWEDASALVTQTTENNGLIVRGLGELKPTVTNPPQYYPYSTERLEAWELELAGLIVGGLAEISQGVAQSLATLSEKTAQWTELLPKETKE